MKRLVWENAPIVQFEDFTNEEYFSTCVHLKLKCPSERCGNALNSEDRQRARSLYLQIRSALANGTSVSDSLLSLAKVTLCNGVHRKRHDRETFYTQMVQKWSNDFEIEERALREPELERVVPETIQTPGRRPPEVAVDSVGYRKVEERSTGAGDADHTASEVRDRVSLLDKPEITVKEEEIHASAQASPLCESSRPDAQPQSKPSYPLPDCVTRCEASPPVGEDYLPYCPRLSTYTLSQLINYTNHELHSYLARPLVKTALKDGCVYIFTRPDDPTLVKIGYTKHSGKERVAAWAKGCCSNARHEFDTGPIPNAWLVERLVQIQLKQYRKREQQCKWNAMCRKKHTEWYEFEVLEAKQTIKRWADWVKETRPWGPDGLLTSDWMSLLDKYRIALKGPDRDEKMWERWVRMKDPREIPVVRKPTTASASTPMSRTAAAAASPATTAKIKQESGLSACTLMENLQTSEPSIQPPSSKAVLQTSNPNTSQTPKPPNARTTVPMDAKRDDSPLSASSSLSPSSPSNQTFSPTTTTITTPVKQSIRYDAFQTPPDQMRRAVLKSALLSGLEDYLATSPGRRRKSPRLTSRLDRKFVDWACGELDEGYCTA